ncbi:amidase [Nocardia terpenica]
MPRTRGQRARRPRSRHDRRPGRGLRRYRRRPLLHRLADQLPRRAGPAGHRRRHGQLCGDRAHPCRLPARPLAVGDGPRGQQRSARPQATGRTLFDDPRIHRGGTGTTRRQRAVRPISGRAGADQLLPVQYRAVRLSRRHRAVAGGGRAVPRVAVGDRCHGRHRQFLPRPPVLELHLRLRRAVAYPRRAHRRRLRRQGDGRRPESPRSTPVTTPPIFSTALEIRDLIAAGRLGAVESTRAVLEYIEQTNPYLNAITAMRAAKALDDARAADRIPAAERGPLHGVPFVIKAVNESEDLPADYGSRAFADYVPGFDTEVVARLRAAGAILIGTTNMPEFGLRVTTDNRLWPATRNPWDTDHSPAGSSGGAAAAVAAGMVPLAQAADGGGSGRVPASACGIVGLKPSRGRTPWAPSAYEQWSGYAVNTQMARTVRDVALMLDVTAGPVPGEPYGLPAPTESFLAACDRAPERLRVAYLGTPPHGAVDAEVASACREAVGAFADQGHEVVEAELSLDGLLDAFLTVMAGNVAALVANVPAARLSELEPSTVEIALHGQRLTAADYCAAVAAAQHRAAEIVRGWADFDLLVTPTLTVQPPKVDSAPPGTGFREQWHEYASWLAFTYPFSITGQPAISVPAGRTAQHLPVGIQLVGAPGAEDRILAAAAAFEQARPWIAERPGGLG